MTPILPLLLLAAAQSEKLPPANPIPLDRSDEVAVMVPVNGIFAGLTAHDGQAILTHVRPEGMATVAIEKPDGGRAIRRMSWADFAGGIKPGPQHLEERMTNPAIDIDGDIAMVWGRYVLLVDGKPHHCGVNHFDMLRENGQWKVLNVTWSQRTTGCED
ncbi:nuclear transport factor 2 family protein [Sphingomonas colocasiae]|uniref:Nuclear transport factor 2 family protein n=1 Tax=Sphingomonas colocasiae TaxID=1848973 RepID=A0ABS7PPA7_9SPHN|nr:nuclear transport factor 2 family protein [Sphingomonas colocasiae]MBY8823123.1 nuclear transport factor 2 family protein [Sphingomonas colocasiae]